MSIRPVIAMGDLTKRKHVHPREDDDNDDDDDRSQYEKLLDESCGEWGDVEKETAGVSSALNVKHRA